VTPMIETEQLLQDLEDLPAQQAVALHVLQVAGDPRTSAAHLAEALVGDPAITAQVIRLANSAYYGLSARVSSVTFAVTIIGFSSIRSVVAAFAAGALGEDASVPDGFWQRASASASSCSLLAARLGAPKPETFSVGLLHELGDFLLFRAAPDAYEELHRQVDHWTCRRRARVERELFGVDHGEAIARCLDAWLFPAELVEAMSCHVRAEELAPPMAKALVGGQAISALSFLEDEERRKTPDLLLELRPSLKLAKVPVDAAWGISRQARDQAAALAASFKA
jgi:HD-like signal output (HDOD) protein